MITPASNIVAHAHKRHAASVSIALYNRAHSRVALNVIAMRIRLDS